MLSANCPQYNLSAESARARIGEPGSAASYLLTMRWLAQPIARYRTVQAAGKAHEGGTAGGRFRVGYQVLTEPFEPVPSMKPRTSGSPTCNHSHQLRTWCERDGYSGDSPQWQGFAESRTKAPGAGTAYFGSCDQHRRVSALVSSVW